MKKILLFGLAFYVIMACRSESTNDENQATVTIVGVWNPVKEEIISGKDSKTLLETDIFNDCLKKGSVEFTSDNKVIEKYYGYDNKNICTYLNEERSTYSYDKTNNKLIIDNNVIDVIELTKTSFVIKIVDHDYNNDDIADNTLTYFNR